MKIEKQGENLIVTIPLLQDIYNTYMDDESLGKTANVIGVIAGDELAISQLNDLSYKDDQQEGPPLIHFYGEREEFLKICKDLNIAVWKHELCVRCRKPIYGTFTWNDGPICYNCELEEDNKK
jgi:hypothetical protein